jgi:hypothetical protein
VDFVAGLEGVEVLGFVEVPEHGCAVFAARGAEGAVGGDGDGVDVAGVADVVGLDSAGGEFPDLESCQHALLRIELNFMSNIGCLSALVNGCLMARRL